ncbi:peptidoglycan editing factor PgeF [uncultured Psychrosphaera sp.]|uniref:peptidoglycan editing factor PgeF n=1 Tax=uncultured Psychrosphaera sp. TaxID=1403522 RepID=UPI00262A569F|nr:peptidoglycan editing factor PgeF [uncultured Psychrosphaera sp.]
MTWITASFPYLAPEIIEKFGAITTTRKEGVSLAPFCSFNLATHVGDKLTHVRANRAILREHLSSFHSLCEPYWLEQTHSVKVLELPQQYFYECATDKVPEADASFTRKPQTTCVVMTADCLPLLIVNDDATEVAAVHAGWKGLANGIIEQTMNAMTSSNETLHVWLGPAIGPNAFEVGEDVRQQFVQQSNTYSPCFSAKQGQSTETKATENKLTKENKYLADIYALAKVQLKALGVRYISGGEYCTYSQSELFFSYRKEGQTGRMASLIWIKN